MIDRTDRTMAKTESRVEFDQHDRLTSRRLLISWRLPKIPHPVRNSEQNRGLSGAEYEKNSMENSCPADQD